MDAAQFRLPVRIIADDGKPVTEIYSAEQALEFLMTWPHQDGPVFERAMNSCLAAAVDVESRDEAQKSFLAFARVSNILARDMMPDIAALPGEKHALHH